MTRFKSVILIIGCIVVIIAAIQLSSQPVYASLPLCDDACIWCGGTPLCGPNRLGQMCGDYIGDYTGLCRYYDELGQLHKITCEQWCCYWLPCDTR